MPRAIRDALLRLFHEERCLACAIPVLPQDRPTPSPALCPACARLLRRRSTGFCPGCGELAAHEHAEPGLCGDCLRDPPPWRHFLFHGEYAGLLRDLLLQFKFSTGLAQGRLLSALLAMHPELPLLEANAIVPIPLHLNRLRERGFNQAQELAGPVAAHLGIALHPELLTRRIHTPPQMRFPLDERRLNIRGIFVCPGKIAPHTRVLLVDDVATTCATLREAANTLLAAGAATVDVLVAARTPQL